MSATYSPDGHFVLTASADNTARVWEVESGRLVIELKGHGAIVRSATYSPDGCHIVTASADKTARVWDVSRVTRKPDQLAAFIRCHLPVQFDPDNKNIIIPQTPSPQDCADAAHSR